VHTLPDPGRPRLPKTGVAVTPNGYVSQSVVAFLVQFGTEGAPAGSASMLGLLVLVAAGACAGGLMLPLLGIAITRGRAGWRGWRSRRARGAAASSAECRARAMMSELCPHGWRAQITLYQGQTVQDTGEPVRGPVALDWYELRPGGLHPAVMRRVWADSLREALEAMVADRRTDETLEQIELRASADGAAWPDLL
jgi:hypothetical protein